MKDYKTTIGASLLMLMIGLCPLIFTVIARVVTGSPTAEVYGLPVSYMIGGIFACIAAKKIFNVNVGDHIRKPELKIMLLIIAAAVCYSVADIYIVNRASLLGNAQDSYSASEIYTLLTTAFMAPISEELIFRLGMLSILLIGACKNKMKYAISVCFISIPWLAVHFPKNHLRIIDILIVSVIISTIYILTKNIIYCITFHMAANCVTMLSAVTCKFFFAREYILYIALAALAIAMPLMFIYICKKRNEHDFQPIGSLRAI